MSRFALRTDQFSLLALMELTAGCGLVFAAVAYKSFLLFTLVFAILAVWSLRVPAWPLRWPMVVWFGGCCAVSLGLLCVEFAFAQVRPEVRSQALDWLAFFGPMISVLGGVFALAGFCLLLAGLYHTRRQRGRFESR